MSRRKIFVDDGVVEQGVTLGNNGLVLKNNVRRDSRGFIAKLDGLLGGGNRELGLVNSRRGGGGRCALGSDLGGGGSTTKHLLDFAGVVTSILLTKGRHVFNLVLRNTANLLSLRVDNLRGVVDMVVNKLLVGSVDQGHEEENGGANDGQTPVGDELDEIVGDEGSSEGLQCVSSVHVRSGS